jgi:hypothetical protein
MTTGQLEVHCASGVAAALTHVTSMPTSAATFGERTGPREKRHAGFGIGAIRNASDFRHDAQ